MCAAVQRKLLEGAIVRLRFRRRSWFGAGGRAIWM